MNFFSDKQKFEYECQKVLYPDANFQQSGDKILMSWQIRYYQSGLLSTWIFHRYITKTGKLTRIVREKIFERK